MIDEAAVLYGLEPSDFVAARTTLARSLRADGRKVDAAAVAKLRRPSVVEHALNRAVRSDGGLGDRWATAIDAVGRAQAAAIGGGGPRATGDDGSSAMALRQAMAELRACTASLVDAAVRCLPYVKERDARRNDVIGLVRSLATPEGASVVRCGIVGAAPLDEPVLFEGAVTPTDAPARVRSVSSSVSSSLPATGPTSAGPPPPPPPPTPAPAPAPAHADRGSGVVMSPDRLAERRAARAERGAARAEIAELDASVTTARAHLAAATAASTAARAHLAETHAALAAATRANDDARAQLAVTDSSRAAAADALAGFEAQRRAARNRSGTTGSRD